MSISALLSADVCLFIILSFLPCYNEIDFCLFFISQIVQDSVCHHLICCFACYINHAVRDIISSFLVESNRIESDDANVDRNGEQCLLRKIVKAQC